MFAFHETTRKWICRTAFFALCAAPSLATAGWILSRQLPGRERAAAHDLAGRLHVAATISDWREPRPGVVRIAALRLAASRTGTPLLTVTDLEWRRSNGRRLMSATRVAIEGAGFAELAESTVGWLGDLPFDQCDVRWDRLKLSPGLVSQPPGAAFEMDNVQGRIERDDEGAVSVRLSARMTADKPQAAAVRLVLQRLPSADGGTFHVKLDAAELEIPAWALGLAAPGFGDFGPTAQFHGVVEGTGSRRDFRGSLVGSIRDVDVAAAWPSESPHVVRGIAKIELAEMHWRLGRIEEMSGTVTLENGQISRSAIAAAAKHLLCVPMSDGTVVAPRDVIANLETPRDPSHELVTVDRLACRFVLNGRGLTLTGAFPADSGLPEGCLVVSGVSPLLSHPPCVELPLGAWVQFVMGPAASWLPATRGAVEVAGRLPLPGEATTQVR